MRYLLIACAAVSMCGSVWDVKKIDYAKYVTIDVYYDATDGNSKYFLWKQLKPTLKKVWNNVVFRLNPYGKTTREQIDGKWNFTCQRGEDGCFKNKIHGCILQHKDFYADEMLDLIVCNLGNNRAGFDDLYDPALTLVECVEAFDKKPDLEHLYNCAAGSYGDQVLAFYGKMTDNLKKPLDYLPTVRLDSLFFGAKILSEETARKGLLEAVCRAANTKKTWVKGCEPWDRSD